MIVINIEKAKLKGHEIRKEMRDKEFEPYDKIIALQIPGENHDAAEAERVKIRQKYEIIEQKINMATTTEEIRAALEI